MTYWNGTARNVAIGASSAPIEIAALVDHVSHQPWLFPRIPSSNVSSFQIYEYAPQEAGPRPETGPFTRTIGGSGVLPDTMACSDVGAPRPMKMGTTRSPCPYDASTRRALQSASLQRFAILHYDRSRDRRDAARASWPRSIRLTRRIGSSQCHCKSGFVTHNASPNRACIEPAAAWPNVSLSTSTIDGSANALSSPIDCTV